MNAPESRRLTTAKVRIANNTSLCAVSQAFGHGAKGGDAIH